MPSTSLYKIFINHYLIKKPVILETVLITAKKESYLIEPEISLKICLKKDISQISYAKLKYPVTCLSRYHRMPVQSLAP